MNDAVKFIHSQVEIAEGYAAEGRHGLACSACLWGCMKRFDRLNPKNQALVLGDMQRIYKACEPALLSFKA